MTNHNDNNRSDNPSQGQGQGGGQGQGRGRGGSGDERGPLDDLPAVATLDEIRNVPRQRRRELHDLPNVNATGIGPRYKGGNRTRQPALLVYVDEKVPEDELAEDEKIPQVIDGCPTDVKVAEPPTAEDGGPGRTQLQRPVCGGHSVGHPDIGAGSASALLQDSGGNYRLLTNRHIAADDTPSTVTDDTHTVGDEFRQPGPADHDTNGESIGTVDDLCTWSDTGSNTTDSALIDVSTATGNDDISTRMLGAGDLVGFGSASVADDDLYVNFGRTTGLTCTVLTDDDYSTTVTYNEGESDEFSLDYTGLLRFEDSAASDPGDSGSLWGRVDSDTGDVTMIGLHFASGPTAVPVSAVETEHGSLSAVTDSSLSTTPSGQTGTADFFECSGVVNQSTNRAQLPALIANTGGESGTQTVALKDGNTTIDSTNVTLGYGEFAVVDFDVSSLGQQSWTITVETGDDSEQFNFERVEQTEYETIIQVEDGETGGSIEGVTVDPENGGTDTTDGNGRTDPFWLPGGTQDVSLSHPDYTNRTVSITVDQNETHTLALNPPDTASLTIEVLHTQTGDPIENAEVTLSLRE